MGQTQLLLIALGVILVGIAVIVGMNLFHTSAVESNRNGLNNDLLNIANMAHAYYKKPASQDGGDNKFIGFQIPSRLKNNDNGTYSVLYARSDQALIQGVGKETTDLGLGCEPGFQITHRILVYPDSVQIEQVY